MRILPLLLAVLILAGCARIGDPPISAMAICDARPAPKGCEP
ncbi:MAG: hypothetical protein ACK5PJ_05190 [Ralstonia sp.]|jgi:hypothetical protein